MPFTPLHMGPGLAVKAVMQRKFSLLVFGWSQVVIDLQPLLAMTTGREPRHLPVRWPVAFGSAFIGTYSHVLIDSVMHVDVLPFYPFNPASPLHALISIDALHVVCLATAAAGGLAWYAVDRAIGHKGREAQ